MWYCDICGEPIQEAGDGLVFWLHENQRITGYRLVHAVTCDLPHLTAFENLSNLLGVDGLVNLTGYLTVGPLLRAQGRDEESEVQNVPEFIELVRRLHVPHYEEARKYFGHPSVVEHYIEAQEVAPYKQEQLADIIKRGTQGS